MLGLGTPPCPAFTCCNNFLSLAPRAFSQSTRLPSRFLDPFSHRRWSLFNSRKCFSPISCPCLQPSSCRSCKSGVWSSCFYTSWEAPAPPLHPYPTHILSSLFPPQTVFSDVVQAEFEVSVSAAESHFLGVNFQKWTISWSDDLFRYIFNANKNKVCNVGGLASTPDVLTVIGFYHWPNILTTFSIDFIMAEHLLPSVFTLLRVCHPFTIKDTVTTAHTRITQWNTGRPGMCFKLSEITSKAPRSAPGLVGRWMQWGAAGLSCLVGFTALPLACQYSVGHN